MEVIINARMGARSRHEDSRFSNHARGQPIRQVFVRRRSASGCPIGGTTSFTRKRLHDGASPSQGVRGDGFLTRIERLANTCQTGRPTGNNCSSRENVALPAWQRGPKRTQCMFLRSARQALIYGDAGRQIAHSDRLGGP